MYIARRFIDNHLQYTLCQSYHDGACLTNRDLVNLGENPEQFITYPIEIEMANLPGVVEIRSVSPDSSSFCKPYSRIDLSMRNLSSP